MFAKAIITLLFSLAATVGFSWLVSIACSSKSEESPVTGPVNTAALQVANAFPSLTFASPVEFTYADDGSNRVFVVEQPGRILVFENSSATKSATPYLDIRSKVAYGGEMGLLGLAFHPNFKENGYLYVNYTKNNPRETVISRFKAPSATATQVDPTTEEVLLTFAQPYANHNGGKILFGPDGFLYIATGDGGSGGDPQNNSQNLGSLLGKVLRIDVNSNSSGKYGIPADNPFVGKDGARGEIFAYGLRNPWRISFDEQGRLWAGDVGQNKIEEIDIVAKGGNYGWRLKEARACYNPGQNCNSEGISDPIWQYTHDNGDVSVTGGVVYRGQNIPALKGKYVYADYASGRVWALTITGNAPTNQEIIRRAGAIAAFGEDQKHELYLCNHGEGTILRLVTQ